MKRKEIITAIFILVAIAIISIYNIRRHQCVVDDINYSSDYKMHDVKSLKNILNNNKLRKEEKYLVLGLINLKENTDKVVAREYFQMGVDNINKNTCKLVKTYLYKYLSQTEMILNNMDSAIEKGNEALLSVTNNYESNYKLISDIIKITIKIDEGRDNSITYIVDLLDSRKISLKYKLKYMRLLSAIYIMNDDYTKAVSLNIEMFNLSDDISEDDYINKYYINKSMVDMSIISRDMGGYKIALEILNKISSGGIKDEVLKADLEIYKNINLAQVYIMLGDNEKALESIKEVSKYKEYIPSSKKDSVYCVKSITMADAYINSNNIELAKKHLKESEKYLDKAKNTYPNIKNYYNIVLGAIEFRTGNYEESIKIFEDNFKMLEDVPNKEYERISIIYLIELYAQVKDRENMGKYVYKYKENRDESTEIFVTSYYSNILNKENYEELNEKEVIQVRAILILFTGIVILVLVVSKTIIYPYIKTFKDRKYVKSYLENDLYILNYQPIINPINNKIKGYESLLRLKLGDKIIYPDVIIGQINKSDMMYEVSIWILKQIVNRYNEIIKLNTVDDLFYISMNVSLKEIENETFCNECIEILKSSGLNKKSICLEITENISGKDYTIIKRNLNKLMDNGFLIAIDDFGVEYSNLSFLEKLNFDIVKLDKYFMDNYMSSVAIQGMIELLHYVSIKKGISIVVEGVEKKEQVEYIKDINSKDFYIQGYYYSKPVEIDKINKINIQK